MEILNRYTSEVIYKDDAPTMKPTVEVAIKSGVSLCNADLCGANLRDANLRGAYLRGANLRSADQAITLTGERPLFSLGGIGPKNDYLYAYITDQGVYVGTDCFFGTLEEFAKVVEEKHGGNVHGREYRAVIELIKVRAGAPEK